MAAEVKEAPAANGHGDANSTAQNTSGPDEGRIGAIRDIKETDAVVPEVKVISDLWAFRRQQHLFPGSRTMS